VVAAVETVLEVVVTPVAVPELKIALRAVLVEGPTIPSWGIL
jgi:hypothetical protein